MDESVAYPDVNLGTLRAQSVSVGKSAVGKSVWENQQSPVSGWGAKPPENFDNLLVKITFLKLNMPFYET